MREAFGGIFQIQIAITFFVVLIALFSFGIKYVQAFKMKNYIINQLEIHEGLNDDSGDEIMEYVEDADYFIYHKGDRENAFEICRYDVEGMGHVGIYYKVKTHINFKFPVIDLNLQYQLKGETRMIYKEPRYMTEIYSNKKFYIEIKPCR